MPDDVAELIGRSFELSRIHAALTGLANGGHSAMLLGDPGIGKTAILDASADGAKKYGLQVLRCAGTEAESEVSWAVLHQLIYPLRQQIPRLPTPQRAALDAAFGVVEASPPNVFLVGMAVLTLLSDAAESDEVLVVVDDLHWVDTASRFVITFIERRIEQEPIAILLAGRDGALAADLSSILDRTEVIRVEPLSPDESVEVLSRAGVPPHLQDQVLSNALGNPLALLELGAAAQNGLLNSDQGISLPRKLELAFGDRILRLGPVERQALLVAALKASAGRRELLRIASILQGGDVAAEILDTLVNAGLLRRDSRMIAFVHPLVRTAAVQLSTPAERARVHRAIAASLPVNTDRRLWHLAVVADSPDEDLATELARAGDRLLAAGTRVPALHAYRRSAELSVSGDVAALRLFHAARVALVIGQLELCRDLVQQAGGRTADQSVLSRLALLREMMPGGAIASGDLSSAFAVADELHASGDSSQAVEVLSILSYHVWEPALASNVWQEVITHVESYGFQPDEPRLLWMKAYGLPGRGSIEARKALEQSDLSGRRDPRDVYFLIKAATAVGDLSDLAQPLEKLLVDLRETADILPLASALHTVSEHAYNAGRFADAFDAAQESYRLCEEAGEPLMGVRSLAHMHYAKAVFGETHVADLRSFAASESSSAVMSVGMVIARGVAAAARGEHDIAFHLLLPVVLPDHESYHWFTALHDAFPHFVDAAVRAGRRSEASAVTELLLSYEGLADGPLYAAYLALARAELAPEATAQDLFTTAIRAAGDTLPFWRARAQLALGERLRRGRRIAEAREHLREAYDDFERMSVGSWSSIARAELRAAGDSVPRHRPHLGIALTAQEQRVSQLAASGLSNRDIAARLFLSPRTVGAHLYSVYRKLGVSSRTQLPSLDA